jgi:hypothetical protein
VKSQLDIQSAGDCFTWTPEDTKDTVALAAQLDEPSLMIGNGFLEDLVMHLHGATHFFGMLIPGRGGLFDVAEQKRQRSTG